MIRFTESHFFTNNDAYIYYYTNVDLSQDRWKLPFNYRVEDLDARDLALAAVGKGENIKTTKRKMDSLGTIKDCIGLDNSKINSKRLKGNLELADALDEVIRMDKYQNIK